MKGNVLARAELRDEVALHVLEDELPEPRREALDKPIGVVGGQRHGLAGVIDAHHLERHRLRHELLVRPGDHLFA